MRHVGLIDAHAEGDGGHHDFDLPFYEFLLYFVAMIGIETRVVGGRSTDPGEFLC